MVNSALTLNEYKHPNKGALMAYNALIAIDFQKGELLKMLSFMLDSSIVEKWKRKHHSNPILMFEHLDTSSPLIILSGEVGCGKTALAQSIATPLGEKLGRIIKVFETPSNIRGSGLVGEISNRITDSFTSAKSKIKENELGILIIDEADDIATSRAQNQAHHEDRAGLNVLIKQIDLLKKEKINMAVIMITNRVTVLDPAIRRRTSLHLLFERPEGEKIEELLSKMFENTEYTKKEFDALCSFIDSQSIPFSFSDLIQRAGKQALLNAIENDKPFSLPIYKEILERTEPSPLITEINQALNGK